MLSEWLAGGLDELLQSAGQIVCDGASENTANAVLIGSLAGYQKEVQFEISMCGQPVRSGSKSILRRFASFRFELLCLGNNLWRCPSSL